MNRSVVVLAALLAAAPAAAASPRWGSFEIGAQNYHPDIDVEFGGATSTYDTIFGSGRGWIFTLGVSRALFTKMGSLELGVRTGFFQDSGKARVQGTGDASADTTKFYVIPSSLSLTYRFDLPVERHNVPLAPYVRATLERYNWWTSGGGPTKEGATNGWSATGGVAFLLDFVDSGMARELDQDTGINHTYLFAEATKTSIDDFGSSSSWDLSDRKNLSLAFGLLFVF